MTLVPFIDRIVTVADVVRAGHRRLPALGEKKEEILGSGVKQKVVSSPGMIRKRPPWGSR